LADPSQGIGHGQFNELLLTLGYDRVSHAFFQYLVDETTDYQSGAAIRSLDHLSASIDRFRKLGMLLYGNVKFAFKTLSSDRDDLLDALDALAKRDEQSFKDRHEPIHTIDKIPGEKTYYLGYLIEAELKKRLKDANDKEAIQQEEIRQAT